jgi:hypothetical protein
MSDPSYGHHADALARPSLFPRRSVAPNQAALRGHLHDARSSPITRELWPVESPRVEPNDAALASPSRPGAAARPEEVPHMDNRLYNGAEAEHTVKEVPSRKHGCLPPIPPTRALKPTRSGTAARSRRLPHRAASTFLISTSRQHGAKPSKRSWVSVTPRGTRQRPKQPACTSRSPVISVAGWHPACGMSTGGRWTTSARAASAAASAGATMPSQLESAPCVFPVPRVPSRMRRSPCPWLL